MTPTWNAPLDYKGIYANYRRLASNEKFTPPFVWSGRVKLNDVMYPGVFGWGWREGETVSYQPKLNFHPMYQGNERNVVLGPGNPVNPLVVGISAECRDLRPERPYGVRTGYVSRFREDLPSNPIGDGKWHHFLWQVDSWAKYSLYWDGKLVCAVEEKEPSTIDHRPVPIGLRLDFLDVEFDDMKVVEEKDMTYRIVPRTEIGLPSVVVGSDGSARPPLYNERYVTIHYTGVNTVYDGRDVPAQIRHIQAIFSATKPFEYNYVIGQDDETDNIYEFAGKFRAAHSAGENDESFGVLFLNGVNEPFTPTQIKKFQWLRDVLIFDGSLRPTPDQRPHKYMPGAATACPGEHGMVAFPELIKPYQAPNMYDPPRAWGLYPSMVKRNAMPNDYGPEVMYLNDALRERFGQNTCGDVYNSATARGVLNVRKYFNVDPGCKCVDQKLWNLIDGVVRG